MVVLVQIATYLQEFASHAREEKIQSRNPMKRIRQINSTHRNANTVIVFIVKYNMKMLLKINYIINILFDCINRLNSVC